jgi:CBS domain containing-hemolysin-like protein
MLDFHWDIGTHWLMGVAAISFLGGALFAFLETAVTSLRPYQVRELETSAPFYKRLFELWKNTPQRLLVSILVLSNFFEIAASISLSRVLERSLGSVGVIVGMVVATVLTVIFVNIVPKTLAQVSSGKRLRVWLWLVNAVVKLFKPAVTVLLGFVKTFFAMIGTDSFDEQTTLSEKEIKFMIDQSDEHGIMDAEKSEMLQNIFGLGETQVSKVMIPRFDMALLNINLTIRDAVEAMRNHRFSRFPVYDGKEDNIVGIIYHKDLFDHFSRTLDKPLKDLVRPIMFVPETKRINQLLNEFLKKRMHMSIVIDEFGGVIGLVTLEDLIEEIVGEISDEHEKIHTGVIPLEQGGWLVNASIILDKLEEFLNITFDVVGSLTLAGFLSEKFQYVPKVGEQFSYRGYIFKIQQATDKRILQVVITHSKPAVVTASDNDSGARS